MAGQKTELKIQIIGEDSVNAILDKTVKKTKEVEKQTDALADATESWGDQIKGSRAQFALMATGINQASEIMSKLVSFGKDLVDTLMKAAAQDAVGMQFARSFNQAADAMERFQTAAAGTLGKQQLQQFTIELQQAGRSAGDIEGLLDIAARIAASGLGAAKGILTTADAMEILSDSIIGASDSDLEKIGVLFDMPDAADRLAKSLGQVKNKGLESKAIFEFIMKDLPTRLKDVDIAGSAVTQAQRLQSEMQDTADLWDQRAASILKAGRSMTQASNEAADASTQAFKGYEVTFTGAEGAVINLTEAFKASAKEALSWQRALEAGMEAGEALNRSNERLGISTEEYTRRLSVMVEGRNSLAVATRAAADAEFEFGIAMLESAKMQAVVAAQGKSEAEEKAARLKWEMLQRQSARQAAGRGGGGGDSLRGPLAGKDISDLDGLSADFTLTQAEAATQAERLIEASRTAARAAAAEYNREFSAEFLPQAEQDRLSRLDQFSEEGLAKRQAAADRLAAAMDRLGDSSRSAFSDAVRGFDDLGAAYGEMADNLDKLTQKQTGQADATNRSSQELRELGETMSKVAGAANQIMSEVDRVSATLAEFQEASKTSGDAWAASASGMISASGSLVASFIDDQMVKAIVMHFSEAAAAISSYAVMDIQGGIMHSIASAMWGVTAGVAASKGKGGGAGGGATAATARPPSFGDSGDRGGSKGDTINITVQGNVMNDVQMERTVTRAMSNSKRRRGDAPESFMGAR